ncbi:MAG: OmpA family protein [Massilia sp.]
MKKTLLIAALLAAGAAHGQSAPPPADGAGAPIVVSGTVVDEAARAALLARLRQVFGAARVVDQLSVGSVSATPDWNERLSRLIRANLKQVSHGQLKFEGDTASVRGDVASEALRQQIGAELSASAGAGVTINNGLRVVATEQSVLDATLANRIIEFDSGKATLTDSGRAILDQMSVALLGLKDKKVEVIGHTDNAGSRAGNLALSQARAEAVRSYVAAKGVKPDNVAVSGEGPDRPVADNRTAEGRARNRRIEFKVVQ